MSCWEVLGLPHDADTRTIKRQYAVLLKQHRPDEDPSGFQRLREAYEHALAWSRFEAPAETAQPVPVDSVQPAPAEPDTRVEQARALVAQATPSDLRHLYQQARDSECADAFEALLLQRCLTSADPAISEWAVTHLHWLTPLVTRSPPHACPHTALMRCWNRCLRTSNSAWSGCSINNRSKPSKPH
ncbi:hypothetical protein LRQ11_13265 [Pseudomonas sp. MAFF 311095]|uniref:J domain-containing protein n=1 Tax=Pseudomonas petroselini TaxID=2899822 RepID=UPI0020B2509C|nr:J domain-containing protein [Pseudomonas petroselini]MCD7079764.1 hypothetical protein [Pseudomonas petroselini]